MDLDFTPMLIVATIRISSILVVVHQVCFAHCAKDLLIVKKIQPNLIPSKIIPIGCVDLNSKIKFAICHWTWEIGYIWHLQRKSGCFMGISTW